MSDNIGCKEILKIGFVHDENEVSHYKEYFDIIVTKEGDFSIHLALWNYFEGNSLGYYEDSLLKFEGGKELAELFA